MTLKIVDIEGRMIEQKIVTPNARIEIGHGFGSGVYIINALQGDMQQNLKLVKL